MAEAPRVGEGDGAGNTGAGHADDRAAARYASHDGDPRPANAGATTAPPGSGTGPREATFSSRGRS